MKPVRVLLPLALPLLLLACSPPVRAETPAQTPLSQIKLLAATRICHGPGNHPVRALRPASRAASPRHIL